MLLTLPTSPNSDFGGDVLCGMKRPVVDDLWIVLLIRPLFAIDDQIDDGKIDIYSVVVPLVVANLRQFPAPFCRSESVLLAFLVFLAQKQYQFTVANK